MSLNYARGNHAPRYSETGSAENAQASLAHLQETTSDTLHSLEDVARRLKCHKRTVSRMVAKGELKPVRFNCRMIRFKQSEIEALINRSQG